MPEPYTTNIALYFIFNAIDNDNNALACLFIKTAIISPAVFLVGQIRIEVYNIDLALNLSCLLKRLHDINPALTSNLLICVI